MPSTAAKNGLIKRLRAALDDGISMADVAAAAGLRAIFEDDAILDLREGRAKAAAGSYTRPSQRLCRTDGGKSREPALPAAEVAALTDRIATKLTLVAATTSVVEARQRIAVLRTALTPKPDDTVGLRPVINRARRVTRTRTFPRRWPFGDVVRVPCDCKRRYPVPAGHRHIA
ncbi:MAG: hypothetical protein WB565_10080 [Acidimicrobiales bacterium]